MYSLPLKGLQTEAKTYTFSRSWCIHVCVCTRMLKEFVSLNPTSLPLEKYEVVHLAPMWPGTSRTANWGPSRLRPGMDKDTGYLNSLFFIVKIFSCVKNARKLFSQNTIIQRKFFKRVFRTSMLNKNNFM